MAEAARERRPFHSIFPDLNESFMRYFDRKLFKQLEKEGVISGKLKKMLDAADNKSRIPRLLAYLKQANPEQSIKMLRVLERHAEQHLPTRQLVIAMSQHVKKTSTHGHDDIVRSFLIAAENYKKLSTATELETDKTIVKPPSGYMTGIGCVLTKRFTNLGGVTAGIVFDMVMY